MADEPKSDGESELPKIRTFKTDTEEYIKEKKISRLDIARGAYVASQDGLRVVPARKFNYQMTAVALAATLILGAAGYFAFRLFLPAAYQPMPASPEPFANFLPIENRKTVTFSESNPGALSKALLEERSKNLRSDTVIYFPIKILKNTGEEQFAATPDTVRALGWSPPAEFLDNLSPEFNALIVYSRSSNDTAIIFKTKNFSRSLAALLSWERALWFDWKPFLAEEDIKNIARFSWADDIIKNNDARVLKNSGGKIILGYSIFNKQHIVISTSRDALSTILDRLIALPPR